MTKLDYIRIAPAEEIAGMLTELVNGVIDLTADYLGYHAPESIMLTEEQILGVLNSDSGEDMTE